MSNFIEKIIDNLLQSKELTGSSIKWANWMSQLSITTCLYCAENHGKIFDISIIDEKYEVNAHTNCQCVYVPMRTKSAGTATTFGVNGADMYLILYKKLPNNYVKKSFAENFGWKNWKGNLSTVLPGKIIGGDIYMNRDHKLPEAPGRTWYEADINYGGGYRSRDRILYSNDGLIFVSYDHYQTFYEITY